jgi:hypothetical protein
MLELIEIIKHNFKKKAEVKLIAKIVLILIVMGISVSIYAIIPSLFKGNDCVSQRGVCISKYDQCHDKYRAVNVDPMSAKNPCYDKENPEISKELICCLPRMGHKFESQVSLIFNKRIISSGRNNIKINELQDKEFIVSVDNFAIPYSHIKLNIINSKINSSAGCISGNQDLEFVCSLPDKDPKGVSNYNFPSCSLIETPISFDPGNCDIHITLFNSSYSNEPIVEIKDIWFNVE